MEQIFGKCAVALFVLAVGLAAPTVQAQQNTTMINIPTQSLGDALTQLSRETGLQIFFTPDLVAGRTASAISGSMTPAQALTKLLVGSGLEAHQGQGGEYVVQATSSNEAQLSEVKVMAASDTYPGGQVAKSGRVGLLGDKDVMDTPFNVTNYTAQTIQDQQARTLVDVVANNASVREQWSAESYTGPLLIRGFNVSNQDVAFDGLYGISPVLTVASQFADRVEILEGPSALLNGMAPSGSIGGNINVVPKRAGDQPLAEFTANYVSDSELGGHIDLSQRYGENKEFGIRFNGFYRNGDTPVNNQSQELGGAMLSMDFRGDYFRWSFDLGYQSGNYDAPLRPTYVAAGVPVPAAPKNTSNWFQPWSYANAEDTFGLLRGEIDLNNNWTAFAAVGGDHNDSYLVAGFDTINSPNGNLTDAPFNFPSFATSNTEEVGVRGQLQTGAVHHELTVSANRIDKEAGSVFPTIATIASNLYDPTFIAEPNIPSLSAPKTSEVNLSSLAIADVLSVLDGKVQLIPGVRQQQVKVDTFNATTGATTSGYDKQAITPTVALVVKPWGQNISLYANYIEGLQQGSTAPAGTVNAGQIFAPFKSKQYETGVKVDFGRLMTTLSLFQIEQPSGITDPATRIYSIDGEQRNRGLEVNVFGEVADGVRLLGGVMFIDGVLVKTANGINDGNDASGVPHTQINFGAEWHTPLIRGLTLSGRVIYTSAQYLDAANTQQIPDWTTFGIGARYKFKARPITLRANVENLFNRSYWAMANSTFGLSPGAPRTFLASATVDF